MEEQILFCYTLFGYHPSQQGTTCSNLATEAQDYGVKTVQD